MSKTWQHSGSGALNCVLSSLMQSSMQHLPLDLTWACCKLSTTRRRCIHHITRIYSLFPGYYMRYISVTLSGCNDAGLTWTYYVHIAATRRCHTNYLANNAHIPAFMLT